jgi:hypothetical protein
MSLEPSMMPLYPTPYPTLALELSVMSMFLTGHLNLAQDPSVMLHYLSVLPIIALKNLSWTRLSPCSP